MSQIETELTLRLTIKYADSSLLAGRWKYLRTNENPSYNPINTRTIKRNRYEVL